MQPLRRSGLESPHQIRQPDVGLEADEGMHMVRHAAEGVENAALLADDTRHVGVEIFAQSRVDERSPFLGAEDEMDQNLHQRCGHAVFPPGCPEPVWIVRFYLEKT
jgi:hypothetical protein